MLTEEELNQNKSEFLDLIDKIDIPGARIEELKTFLCDESDFFTAPASTMYHCNYVGGLCYHSLNVYHTLAELADMYFTGRYEQSTLIAVALLHDISKANFYEMTMINKKVYNPQGTKHDNMGNFDWISEPAFKVKDAKDRFLAGTHEENSMLLLGRYIPLTQEEMAAVMNHHFGVGDSKQNYDSSAVANKYPLVTLLHVADFLSTFAKERNVPVDE